MPTMYEIYNSHSAEYDELVNHEDYRGNLRSFLRKNIDWMNKTIFEFGIGTGRVTKMYIDLVSQAHGFDRSQHMLDKARHNLADHKDKIVYSICDNSDIASVNGTADIVVEGWSFGHFITDDSGIVASITDQLISSCISKLKPGGTIIFIETLGTNVESPTILHDSLAIFYRLLESKYNFVCNIVETDYSFPSSKESERIMGFFFGDSMREDIRRKKLKIIKEYTGIWVRC